MKKQGRERFVAKLSLSRTIVAFGFMGVLSLISLDGQATEGGTAAFPPGGEDFAAAQMPPPGWYGEIMASRYRATSLKGSDGNTLPVAFDLTVQAATAKIAWIKPAGLLGSDNWATLLIIPTVDIDVALSPAPGVRLHDRRRGIADVTLGNALHWTFPQFQLVNAIDLTFPTGNYDKGQLANPGQNRGVFRLVNAGTWTPESWCEVSYRLNWDHHRRNSDTGYQSGQLLNLNYAVGWTPTPGTVFGLAGYLYRQLFDDEQNGKDVGNRLRVNGIGVAAKRFFPTGQFVDIKWYRESGNRNAPEGSVFWIYAGTRF